MIPVCISQSNLRQRWGEEQEGDGVPRSAQPVC